VLGVRRRRNRNLCLDTLADDRPELPCEALVGELICRNLQLDRTVVAAFGRAVGSKSCGRGPCHDSPARG
jgi:hypothetical protein